MWFWLKLMTNISKWIYKRGHNEVNFKSLKAFYRQMGSSRWCFHGYRGGAVRSLSGSWCVREVWALVPVWGSWRRPGGPRSAAAEPVRRSPASGTPRPRPPLLQTQKMLKKKPAPESKEQLLYELIHSWGFRNVPKRSIVAPSPAYWTLVQNNFNVIV